MASNYFHSMGVPCFLYIDDSHNGQLQVPLDKGQYAALESDDERNVGGVSRGFSLDAFGVFPGLIKVNPDTSEGGPVSRFPGGL